MAEAGDSLEYPDSGTQIGSDALFDIVCTPCTSEDKNTEAQGYCADCREHLCGQCISYHKKFAITKNHTIIGQESMPRNIATIDICIKRCQTHSDEVIKYFCPTHKVLGCSVCVTLKHKLCEDVEYIPEVAKDIESSQDFKDVQAKLNQLMKKFQESIQSASTSLTTSAESFAKALHDIQSFRQIMNSALDRLEKETKQKAIELKEKDLNNMETVMNKGDQALRQLQSISSSLEALLKDKQYCQLFIDIKTNNSKLSELEDILKLLNNETLAPYEFIPNRQLQMMVESTNYFGKIVPKDKKKTRAVHVTDIKVKSDTDTSVCGITGATKLSQDNFLFTDFSNKCVTLIDTMNYKVIAQFKLKSKPWDVAAVSENQVAVTIPDEETIVFLTCDCNKIAHARMLNAKGKCRGIACYRDKLFVTFDKQKKVKMMSMTGEVIQTFEKDGQGENLFEDPTYVAVSADGKFMYISEWDNNRVVKVGMDGKLVSIYTDTELQRACKLVLDETDMMYICFRNSNNVHLVTTDCEKIKVLLEKSDRLENPLSLCYCEVTGRLFIGMKANNVKVYKLTYGH